MSLFAPPAPGYYQPPSFTGGGSFGRQLAEDNPASIWQQLLDQILGVTQGNDARSQYYRDQLSPWYNRYLATAGTNPDPTYGFTDFVQQYQNQIQNAYGDASPQQRGENPSRFAPRMRFVGFPG